MFSVSQFSCLRRRNIINTLVCIITELYYFNLKVFAFFVVDSSWRIISLSCVSRIHCYYCYKCCSLYFILQVINIVSSHIRCNVFALFFLMIIYHYYSSYTVFTSFVSKIFFVLAYFSQIQIRVEQTHKKRQEHFDRRGKTNYIISISTYFRSSSWILLEG